MAFEMIKLSHTWSIEVKHSVSIDAVDLKSAERHEFRVEDRRAGVGVTRLKRVHHERMRFNERQRGRIILLRIAQTLKELIALLTRKAHKLWD